jgi:signal transduction histidine kinase/pSer/pThr/pTyr-binding forkhead associated (FHA) protein
MLAASLSRMTLRAVTGDLQGQTFRVETELVIGRSTSCGIFVSDRRISREHARLWTETERLFLEDLGSHNGTYVNGQRIDSCELFHGDTVRLGSSQFAVEGGSHETSDVIKVVQVTQQFKPRIVRPVEPITQGNLARISTDEYFSSIGISVQTDRLQQTSEQVQKLLEQTRQFAILHEVAKSLQHYTDLHKTLPELLDAVLQVLGGDRTALVLKDDEGELVTRQVRFADKTLDPASQPAITLSKTIVDYVLSERCAVITADAMTDSRFSTAESVVLANIRSLLVVPVLVGNRLLGLLEFENTKSINGYDEGDLNLASIIASMLGVALDHFEMSQARERAIQQLQAAQKQLLATQERLIVSERMGVLGRLASGIAHEVKNHLSPFMLADMIAQKYPNDQEIQESAGLMLEAQQRILGLVDEIRTFASGTAASVNIALHDMCSVINGVLRFVRCDRAVKQAELVFQPREHPLVFMDAHRIRQVVINLIRNAADALPPRGGRIEIRVSAQDGLVHIEVADNGNGVPLDVQDLVFEPFFTTKGEKGLGLGLDISRQIAQAHGGSLSFETELGVGTVFRLTLPLGRDTDTGAPYDDMKTDPHAVVPAAFSPVPQLKLPDAVLISDAAGAATDSQPSAAAPEGTD